MMRVKQPVVQFHTMTKAPTDAPLRPLACPVCHGLLEAAVGDRIRCAHCGREYPVVDGIPVLIHGRELVPNQPPLSSTRQE